MFRSAWLALSFLATVLVAEPLPAQPAGAGRPWTLTAGAYTYRISELNGWGVGPAAGAQRRVHRALRLDIQAGVLLSSSGFYDFSGITLDVGPMLTHVSRTIDAGLGAGIASVVGGDSDGTGGGWIGGYFAGQITGWLSPRIGLTGRAAYREITTGRSSPSFGVALAFRL